MDLHSRIEMLGPLRVVQPQRTLTRFGTQKAGSLLAYLALRAGQAVTRESLIDLFWDEMDLSAGRDNLSTTLSTLRRLLEPPGVPRGGILVTDRTGVSLNGNVVTTDVAEFERLVEQARKADTPSISLGLWEQAISLYRGDFLPGCYFDWAVRESERLQGLYLNALAAQTQGLEQAGDLNGALNAARRWAGGDPYSEDAQATLIALLIRTGRPDAARETYEKLEQMLRDEFGTAPSPATRGLVQGLIPPATGPKQTDPKRVTKTVPAQAHALPPAETSLPTEGVGPSPAALPVSFSRFFGREAELALLASLMTTAGPVEGRTRLVTLTGPGGMGKTRLATEFGRRSGHWAGFVPLADLDAADLILPHIAQALRLPAVPGSPPLDQVAGFFTAQAAGGHRPALLILDNLEQIAGAGAVIQALMERVPALLCLCTSRRRLGLRGERLLPLAPLAVPDREESPQTDLTISPADLLIYPSVRLYVDRAQAVRPDFQITPGNAAAVAGLCRTLEGSPLALELAASWVRSLPPRAMWERLTHGLGSETDTLEARYDDLPARHRSLWAALDWSFRLLTQPQQRLFARLSVFRGGWTLPACEAVCDEPDALRLLTDLEDASLIRSAETGDGALRWHFLETVRRHAQSRLVERGEAAWVLGRHLHWSLLLPDQLEAQTRGKAQWLDSLEAEHDNLRAALDHAAASPDASESGLQLAAALLPFWRARGYLAEGQQRTTALLTLPASEGRSGARAAALNTAGTLAMLQSDYAAAEASHQEALTIAREMSDPHLAAAALLGLGNARFYSQDYAAARPLFEESLTLCRETGDVKGMASAYHNLGNMAYREEDFEGAVRCFENALGLRRRLGDTPGVAATMGGLGQVATARGKYREAGRFLDESLRLFAEAGQQWTVALCLENLGRIAEEQGQIERAVRLLGASTALRDRFHFAVPPAERDGHEAHRAELRDALGAAIFDTAWEMGRAMTWEQVLTDAQGGIDASAAIDDPGDQETPSIRS